MVSMLSEAEVNKMAATAYLEESGKASQAGKLNKDTSMTNRVRQISKRIIPQVATFRKDAVQWKWEVNVIDSPELNAYCMAGGKIMFYSGIIDKLKLSDDEIAQIMGHEISHALREHSRERMSEAYAKQMVFNGISVLTGGKYDAGLGVANKVSEVAISLPNSREHESEADMIGLELAARAGYNPNAAVSLWKKMAAASQNQPPQFLSTHPSHSTRIQDLQSKIPVVMPLYESARKK
jgi:predicted Zn-dependent protease